MLKKFIYSLALFSFGCGGNPNSDPGHFTTVGQGPVTIYVANESNLSNTRLQDYVNAINIQLVKDVLPTWGIQASLVINNNPPTGSRTLTLLQDLSRFPTAWHKCTGFHTTNSVGYVDVNECENEVVLSVTISHEALEMLANPDGLKNGHEICDPVGSRYYGYANSEAFDIVVSDFVYPNFYLDNSPGPWDKTGQVKQALHPAPGGEIFSTIGGKKKK